MSYLIKDSFITNLVLTLRAHFPFLMISEICELSGRFHFAFSLKSFVTPRTFLVVIAK